MHYICTVLLQNTCLRIALQKFRDRHGRPPYPASRQSDIEQLKVLLEEVIQELSVPRQLVNDEFTK